MRRVTLDMFGGTLDDRVLRPGDICDKKVVEHCLGVYEDNFGFSQRMIEEREYLYQNPNPYTRRFIGGVEVFHTFRSSELGNFIYCGLCERGKTRNLCPRRMMKVFIISPYAGDVDKNTKMAGQAARHLTEIGCLPVAPHLYFPQFLDDGDQLQRGIGIEAGHLVMEACDGAIILTDFGISEGMEADINYAVELGIPILMGSLSDFLKRYTLEF